jgi:hypothetical protein
METFEGTVRMAGDTVELPAVLLVADDRLRVSAHRRQIGDWALQDISARVLEDECHVTVEGEELVIAVPELRRLAEAIGPSISHPGDGSLLEFGRGATSMSARLGGWIRRPSPSAYAAAAALIATVLLAVWAPTVLVGMVLLASLAGLLVGVIALIDPFTAVRIPNALTPGLLIRAGGTGVLVALALAVVI